MTTLHPVPESPEPKPPARPRLARFGVFELDVASGELRRSGIRVPLQDQPVRLLALLLEHAGEVVSREEIRAKLWPSEFVDFDHSLNTAVRKLRSALDDSAENPRFIETLAKRGYRFVAPVSWNGGDETPPQVEQVAAPSNMRWMPIIAILAVLALAAAAFFFLRKPTAPVPAPAKTIDSIAVLPFWNGDPATQHINDGLTEILIDAISRVPHLRVMAPTTVFLLRDHDPRRAGKELGVAAVVSGRIRRENDRYAVRVELIDVNDGAQLWSNNYDSAQSELLQLQNRIADDLAVALRHGPTNRNVATSPEVYDLYTKGLYAWNRRTKEDLRKALQYFNDAAARDPKFALAYAGIANTYGVMVGYGSIPVMEGTTKIIANAQKALDLDPSNAEALVSLATTKYRNVWDFPGAEADYKRALALNPNYATGHQWYSDYLRTMGRWDEARSEVDTAYRLDPFSLPINAMKCYSLYYERRFTDAIAFSHSRTQADPRLNIPACEVSSYIAMGNVAAAAAVMREKESILFYANAREIGEAYLHGGAQAMFKKWNAVAEHNPEVHNPVGIAMGYTHTGDHDRAFMWLEKAYERRVSLITNINIEPQLDPLHSDPRWDALTKRIGLPKVEPPRRSAPPL